MRCIFIVSNGVKYLEEAAFAFTRITINSRVVSCVHWNKSLMVIITSCKQFKWVYKVINLTIYIFRDIENIYISKIFIDIGNIYISKIFRDIEKAIINSAFIWMVPLNIYINIYTYIFVYVRIIFSVKLKSFVKV